MVHIRDNFSEFEKRGARIVSIAAQTPEKPREFFKDNPIPFPFLLDVDRTVVKDYGVHVKVNFESVNIARHSVFVLDRAGLIKFIYIGLHQADFPGDEAIFEVLDALA